MAAFAFWFKAVCYFSPNIALYIHFLNSRFYINNNNKYDPKQKGKGGGHVVSKRKKMQKGRASKQERFGKQSSSSTPAPSKSSRPIWKNHCTHYVSLLEMFEKAFYRRKDAMAALIKMVTITMTTAASAAAAPSGASGSPLLTAAKKVNSRMDPAYVVRSQQAVQQAQRGKDGLVAGGDEIFPEPRKTPSSADEEWAEAATPSTTMRPLRV
jgi:hypothetical protein